MTGDRMWFNIGLIVGVVGIVLVALGLRRPRANRPGQWSYLEVPAKPQEETDRAHGRFGPLARSTATREALDGRRPVPGSTRASTAGSAPIDIIVVVDPGIYEPVYRGTVWSILSVEDVRARDLATRTADGQNAIVNWGSLTAVTYRIRGRRSIGRHDDGSVVSG